VHLPRQPLGQIVDVSRWRLDETWPVFPVGSKPKRLLICPSDAEGDFLRPGHRYLFKEGIGWAAQQVWSEVVAYEFSRLVDAPVPPALVAFDSETGTPGVLVEFFYGYPGEPLDTRLVHAADIMQGLLEDRKRGRPHGVYDNLVLCRLLKAEEPVKWWARGLAFDAMIGNRDRHPENWGFLITERMNEARKVRLAPLYDNGVSLGYELPEGKMGWAADRVQTYVAKGVHHCGWSSEQDKPAQHAELCGRFLEAYPGVKSIMAETTAMSDFDVAEVLDWCRSFAGPLPFTSERAAFVQLQTRARRDALLATIGE